jgi:hypothetical protein
LEGEAEGKAEGRLDGSAEGLADGERLGEGLGGKEMTRLRILAAAAACQGSEAYTCTLGQVCCMAVGIENFCAGIVTPPDASTVIARLKLSMPIVMVDHVFRGRD